MNFKQNCSAGLIEEYRRKCVSADVAVKGINSGDVIDYGFFNGKPVAVDQALARGMKS
jgi:acyl-CoA hydrolase